MIKVVCETNIGVVSYFCKGKIDFSSEGDHIRFITTDERFREIPVENVYGIYPVKDEKVIRKEKMLLRDLFRVYLEYLSNAKIKVHEIVEYGVETIHDIPNDIILCWIAAGHGDQDYLLDLIVRSVYIKDNTLHICVSR